MSAAQNVTATDAIRAHRSAPTILYIAGSGRSGSTLLERIIGAIPGYVNVGELLDLPRRVVPADERCGCGASFSQCPFWTAVSRRSVGAWTPVVAKTLHRQQHQVTRQRHLPRLLFSRPRSRFAARVDAYARSYGEITSAVAAEAGASCVVDASKWPAIALALHRGGLDARVIHLVRDVRGVVYSLSRNDIVRPHATSGSDVMFHKAPLSGAARWLLTQTEVDVIAARGVPVARLSYDDLVADPATAVRRCLQRLGLDVPAGGLDHVSGTRVELAPSHGLSGNPSRFRHGTIDLGPDNRWQREMRKRDKALTAAIGLPQLLRLSSSGPHPELLERQS